MTHGSDPSDPGGLIEAVGEGPSRRRRPRLVSAGVVAAIVGLVAGAAGFLLGGHVAAPADDSAEVGFARDMQVHHAQAVEMSLIVREKSADPALRAMAYDVITSQQQQIGQMYAWLAAWGHSQASSGPPMAWMAADEHPEMTGMPSGREHALMPDGRMPGMASQADLRRLRAAKGTAAEVLWLRLMIPHHQAGVQMAKALLDRSKDTQVVQLAKAIRMAQVAEIEQMRRMLVDRR